MRDLFFLQERLVAGSMENATKKRYFANSWKFHFLYKFDML